MYPKTCPAPPPPASLVMNRQFQKEKGKTNWPSPARILEQFEEIWVNPRKICRPIFSYLMKNGSFWQTCSTMQGISNFYFINYKGEPSDCSWTLKQGWPRFSNLYDFRLNKTGFLAIFWRTGQEKIYSGALVVKCQCPFKQMQ